MKIIITLFAFFVLLAACKKEAGLKDLSSNPTLPYSSIDHNQEYFWMRGWTKLSGNKYKSIINTSRLTDTVLNRGISVWVAVYSDWDPFEQLPFTSNNSFLADTIRFSYTAIPGRVEIIAETALILDWPSDFLIKYR
jgi:hypothetical protein